MLLTIARKIDTARLGGLLVAALLLALVALMLPTVAGITGLTKAAPAPVQEVLAEDEAAAGTSVTVCNSYKSVRSFRAYFDGGSTLVSPNSCRRFANQIYVPLDHHARSGGSCVNGGNFRTLATGSATEWNVQRGRCPA